MRFNRGDTIIEVMISTAIAALIIVLAITVMNRNLATVQMATEITFARQAIDGQAEALRYLRDVYNKTDASNKGSTVWGQILNGIGSNNISNFGSCMEESGVGTVGFSDSSLHPFFIDDIAKNDQATETTTPVYAASGFTYPQSFPTPGSGVWVEAKKGAPPVGEYQSEYLDLHIRACWDPPYESNNIKATIGTIVRLYYE